MRVVGFIVAVFVALWIYDVARSGAEDDVARGVEVPVTTGSGGPTMPPPESEQVRVPSVAGRAFTAARASLRQRGFDVNVVTRLSHDVAGRVLQQSPRPGATADRGSVVTLTVAAPFPTIPNVDGHSVAAARQTLRRDGYEVSVSRVFSTVRSGHIVSQTPTAGVEARPGRIVTLKVSKGLVDPCTLGYSPCIPPGPDVDCINGTGNGPRYTGTVYVHGPDIYGLDANGDGVACNW